MPTDPARGLVEGLRTLRAEPASSPPTIANLVHGTTIAANTMIERKGANLGLLVTRGFRDVLEIQRLRLDNRELHGHPAPGR